MAEQGTLLDTPTPPAKPAKPSDAYPTKMLWRFVDYYNKNIRNHPVAETRGVIRQIQRLIDKGIPYDDIALALKNYADDEWRKAQDPRYSRQMRVFFTEASVKEWLTPKPKIQTSLPPVLNYRSDVKLAPVQPPLPESEDTTDEF